MCSNSIHALGTVCPPRSDGISGRPRGSCSMPCISCLAECCSLCGHATTSRELRIHLWNNHAKHCNRGSLYRQFLKPLQLNQKTCSVCSLHLTAAHECQVFLHFSAPLVILHHGHHGGSRGTEEDDPPRTWSQHPKERQREDGKTGNSPAEESSAFIGQFPEFG